MIKKRSQVTLYMMIGFFIALMVIIIIINISIKKDIDISNEIGQPRTTDIEFFMEGCIMNELDVGITLLLENSGVYLNVYDYFVEYENKTIQYFYFDNTVLHLNSSVLEKEIKLYADDSIYVCFYKYKEINPAEDKELPSHRSIVSILPGYSEISIEYDIDYTVGNKIKKDEYRLNYQIKENVYDLTLASKEIIEYEQMHEYDFSAKDLLQISAKYDFNLTMIGDNDTIIYRLYNDEPYYEYNFASTYKTYSCTDIPIDDGLAMQAAIELCIREEQEI